MNMTTRQFLIMTPIFLAAFRPGLFSQITFEGTVKNNGAEPVEEAIVELTDQADPGRFFSDRTDKDGRYVIRIGETGTGDVRSDVPGPFRLSQNYPNPFNPSTVISYEITHPAEIRITVHDILGRKVKTLFDGFHSGLSGKIVWDATDDAGRGVPAGIYIYSLSMQGTRAHKKMLLLDGCRSGSTLSLPEPARAGRPPGKKMSDQYRLRVTGPDVETLERQNLQITGNTVLDVTVFRTVTDMDGHVYRTVKIGEQWWMAENLKTTRYRNGEALPVVTDGTAWSGLTTGAACEYGNDPSNSASYGNLYNWHAVDDSRGIAPAGWHVPDDAEWHQLVDFLGGHAEAGGKLKEPGTVHWVSPNWDATNESGFSAVAGGWRDSSGTFSELGRRGRFWSLTEQDSGSAISYGLDYSSPYLIHSGDSKLDGFSIRCVGGFAKVAMPAFSPPPGTYPEGQTVTISCSTPEATLRYTLNGADPEDSDSVYSGPVSIDSTATLKARAYRDGWNPSEVDSGMYTIIRTVATPEFNPPPGIYPTAQAVTLSCPTPNVTIRYTRNGADPEESDSAWSGPIPVGSTVTLKARAYRAGWNPSEVDSGRYTITGTVALPEFSPPPGSYPTAQTVTLSCPDPGATIRYTTNGVNPKETDRVYDRPMLIAHTVMLKARAFKSDWNPSEVGGGEYKINTTTVYCMGNSITAAGRYETVLNGSLGVTWGVVNLGVTGQTTDQMLARFAQDVILPGDGKYVIVLGGVNDARVGRTASQIKASLQAMYTSAHAAGIKVVAVTILPFKNFTGSRPWTPEGQAVLDDVNAWIMTAAVHADFKINAYPVLEDPANPDCLLPAYDAGDGLHPSWAGHIALANAIYHGVTWIH